MTRKGVPLILGAWMTALFWPYAHAGGYIHPTLLALTPLFLSVADLWPQWPLRLVHWSVVLYGELALAWNVAAPWPLLGQVIGGGIRKLLTLPIRDWNQVSAHLAAPLILTGGFLGWLLFRQCRGYRQALALMILGAVVIPANHVFWSLPGNGPLAAYLLLGLAILAIFHQQRMSEGAHALPRPTIHIAIWGLVALLPLVVGFQMPSRAQSDPLGLFSGVSVLARISGNGQAVTGYGAGVTSIGHSLTTSHAPVFLAKTSKPHYWQAAVYTQFNGTSWSNNGPSDTYQANPSNESAMLPLVSNPFSGSLMTETLHATIIDASPKPLTTLFYPGAPTKFSVESVIHPRSQRFITNGVPEYRVSSLVGDYQKSALTSTPFAAPPPSLNEDLQRPQSLSPAVAKLARRITRKASGPWQAAQDIKRYLDHHYRYSYHVTPSHGNVVNHFLFKDRQGYCDQFSTAFIMMMRSIKVPARWAVGYAPGTWDKARHGYLVRAIDAHSWAEIWIKGQGWIPVDPTPGFHFPINTVPASGTAPISTPAGEISPPAQTAKPNKLRTTTPPEIRHPGSEGSTHKRPGQSQGAVRPLPKRWVIPEILAVLLGLILLWRIRRIGRAPLSTRLWRRMKKAAQRKLGVRWHETPSPRQWGQEWVRFFPDDAPTIWPMVRLMEAAFYRAIPLDAQESEQLQQLWQDLQSHRRRGA